MLHICFDLKMGSIVDNNDVSSTSDGFTPFSLDRLTLSIVIRLITLVVNWCLYRSTGLVLCFGEVV